MKLSFNWLKEFIDIKVTPDQLAEDLNSFGHEVEEVKKVGDDYILDLSITANRGDCLSVLGMAREVAAMYNLKINDKHPLFDEKISYPYQLSKFYSWPEINANLVCPVYSINIIDNIEIEKSSQKIIDRLKLYGIRPINNIVDITNYVMLEMGQPLHAFDLNKINQIKSEIEVKDIKGTISPEMYIQYAKPGDSLVTLDGKERILDADNLVIRDSKKIYDLVGIMGGVNSEVDKDTKTIILQSAVFVPSIIRASSKKAKLTTEASYRYERGVDVGNNCLGLSRAVSLIHKSCPKARVIDDVSTGDDSNYGDLFFDLPVKKINNLLGTKISKEIMLEYLKRLGFNYLRGKIVVPDYRYYDIRIWQDLAEEVARIHGYNKLDKNLPFKNQRQSATKSALISDQYDTKEHLKDILAENGFTEIYSYSFTDKKLMQLLGINLNNCRRVINSVAPELEYLRYDLRPSILSAVAKNPWAPEIKIFEIGKVFRVNPRLPRVPLGSRGPNPRQSASEEKWQLGIAECSKNGQGIKQVLDKLGITTDIITPDQKVLDYLKIRRPVRYTVIDLDKKLLNSLSVSSVLSVNKICGNKYKIISQFPPTIRDLAFIVDKKTNADDIRSQISYLDSHILLVELFDEFVSDKLGKDMKNVAYHVWLQDLKKPMNPKKVEDIISKIIKSVELQFKAKLRR